MPALKGSNTAKKTKRILLKLSPKEYELIKAKAAKFSEGNVSHWLRYAGQLEPPHEDAYSIVKENQ